MTEAGKQPEAKRSPWKAALGALCGLRSRADFEKDAEGLNIKHVILAAVTLMIVFVSTILTVVHFVTR